MNQVYFDTARLMTQVAPLVFADNIFALKGGTAINLFIRDMPRLSVDLDLVFRDHTLPREQALEQITAALRQSAERLKFFRATRHAVFRQFVRYTVKSDNGDVGPELSRIEADEAGRSAAHTFDCGPCGRHACHSRPHSHPFAGKSCQLIVCWGILAPQRLVRQNAAPPSHLGQPTPMRQSFCG